VNKLKLWFCEASCNDSIFEASDDIIADRVTLDRALAKLTDKERLVFVLFELEGLSGAEIATIAECPVNTVWRRLFDARRRLKIAIEREGR
jgi:RNA polymerase sigma factor (sigma-70 family)